MKQRAERLRINRMAQHLLDTYFYSKVAHNVMQNALMEATRQPRQEPLMK